MKTPLVPIDILSIYENQFGDRIPLPSRMAVCTPDMFDAIFNIAADVSKKGGKLILSDLFRSYDMQFQSHKDYVMHKKKAFSPPPGGSFHEAGRAFDMDLHSIKIDLSEFWTIAAKYKVVPIINKPKAGVSESWHFDCHGSHQLVYDYYATGKAKNFKPYAASAASAILSIGVQVDAFGKNQKQAFIQSALIRLGKEIGNIDGALGSKTQTALEELEINFDLDNIDGMLITLENMLQKKFPNEYSITSIVHS